MKTKLVTAVLGLLFAIPMSAQDRTTVNALSSEISDNLDLRAVASIFGEARNLDDFERQLNDPKIQISNLDLNNDNRVDYLRVVETVEGYTHLIVVQSVLGMDTFQDVATIEVERDRNNQVTIQVVGDVYMYGPNYIYEPVYVRPPVIYASFWVNHYRPYCSTWYWNYYPTHYYVWAPHPVFRYRNNINVHINFSHHYNYVNVRHSHRAVALYSSRRANYCERQYPTRSFAHRNDHVRNRYELDQRRNTRGGSARNNQVAYNNRNSNGRGNSAPTRDYASTRATGNGRSTQGSNRESNAPRNEAGVRSNSGQRENNSTRNQSGNRRNSNAVENSNPRNYGNSERNPVRENSSARVQENRRSNGNSAREYSQRAESNNRTNSNPVRESSRNQNRASGNIAQNRIESGRGISQMNRNSQQQNTQRNAGAVRNNEQRGGRR